MNKAYWNNWMACALELMFSEVCFHASAGFKNLHWFIKMKVN